MYCVPIDLGSHGILESQTADQRVVFATQAFFHQTSQPVDHGTFSCSLECMHCIQQRRFWISVYSALLLLSVLDLQPSNGMFQELLPLLIGSFGTIHAGGKDTGEGINGTP